jgi:hypothetical protein
MLDFHRLPLGGGVSVLGNLLRAMCAFYLSLWPASSFSEAHRSSSALGFPVGMSLGWGLLQVPMRSFLVRLPHFALFQCD